MPNPHPPARLLRSGLRLLALAPLPVALALALAPAAAAGAGDGPAEALFAGRLSEADVERLRGGGPDAIGGVGDWGLGNGTLCAVVADPAHEGYLMPTGGSLVDLGFCGRDDDHFVILDGIANLSRDASIELERVRAEPPAPGGDEASLVVEGHRQGVRIETRYTLDRRDPRRLLVRSRLERTGPGPRLSSFGDVTIHYDGTLRPFTRARAGRSEGFEHVSTGDASVLELARAIVPVEQVVLVGPHTAQHPISYALRILDAYLERPEGERVALPTFGLSTETITAQGFFAQPFWLGGRDSLGLLQLAQSLWMDIAPGDAVVFERELRAEPTLDASVFTDRLEAGGVPVTGRVEATRARVHVADARGRAVTSAATDARGRFSMRLSRGRYRLGIRAPGGVRLERAIQVGAAPLDLGTLALPQPAWVAIPRGLAPARLCFRGEAGTADPLFEDDLTGFRIAGLPKPPHVASADVHLGGFAGDPRRVPLPPGRYRVHATRGPEFSVTTEVFDVAAGEVHRLGLAPPQRVIATPGWIAADLHVHADPSDDSTVPLDERLRSFLAEGGELIVSTDHDMVSDYAPRIALHGLRDRVHSLVGLEVTSTVATPEAPFTAGHSNVFPMPLRPLLPRRGALPSEHLRLRGIVALAHALPGRPLVQLNHARSEDRGAIEVEGAFFSHLSVGRPFRPDLPLDAPENRSLLERDPQSGLRDLDFDVMEVMNGPSMARYRQLRADWFSLLSQGEVRAATANSDTHTLRRQPSVPRTWVRVPDDAPARLDEQAFLDAVRAGRSQGSTGPFLDVTLGGAGPGERFRGGVGTLRVRVRAAPWVPVSSLRVFVDGMLAHTQTIRAPADEAIDMHFASDGFVSVEVIGQADGLYGTLLPDHTPFAFTNAIFVDADGDGVWTPPGLRPAR